MIDPSTAKHLYKSNYEKLLQDVFREASVYTTVQNCYIATTSTACIGAETGSVFLEVADAKEAEILLQKFNGKSYEKREMKICCVPVEMFAKHIKPSISPN